LSKDVIDSYSEHEKIELVDLILAADFVPDQEDKASTSSFGNTASENFFVQFQQADKDKRKRALLGPSSYMIMRTGWGGLLEPLSNDLDQIFEGSPVKELSSYLESIIYCQELDDFDADPFSLAISPFKKELLACFSGEGLVGTVCDLPGNPSALMKLGNAFAFHRQNAGLGLLTAMQKLCIPGYTSSVELDGRNVELDQFTNQQRRLLTQLIFHSLSDGQLEKFEHPDEERLVWEIIEAIPKWLSDSFVRHYYESDRECQVNGNALFIWVNNFLREAIQEGYAVENADLLLNCLFKAMDLLPPNQVKLHPLFVYSIADEVVGDSGKDICALFEVFDHVNGNLSLDQLAASGVRICQRFYSLNLLSLADSLISLWLICAFFHGFTLPRSDWLTGKIISLLSQDSNTRRAVRFILDDHAMAPQFKKSMPFLALSTHKVLRQNSSIKGIAPASEINPPSATKLVSDEIWDQLDEVDKSELKVLQKHMSAIQFSEDPLKAQEDRRGFVTTLAVFIEYNLRKILALLIEDISKKPNLSGELKALIETPMLGQMIMMILQLSNKNYLKKHPEWAEAIRHSRVYEELFNSKVKRSFFETFIEMRNHSSHEPTIDNITIMSCSYHVKNENLLGHILLAAQEPISITPSHSV